MNTYGHTVIPKHKNSQKVDVDPVDPVDRRPKDPPAPGENDRKPDAIDDS